MFKVVWIYFFLSIFFLLNAKNIGSDTGFQLPRFVSLKSNDSNLRIGSSTNYPIVLKYTIANMPVEIIDEYNDWRKINDHKGNLGWLHKSLIKGDRYGIIQPVYNSSVQIYNKPMGKLIGKIGKNNIVKINTCLLKWCLVSHSNNKGWITKNNLWGVYKEEKINIPFYQLIKNQIWKINF
jgi:SH3-like domain-containing protein